MRWRGGGTRTRGITLLETLAVLALAGILGGAAVVGVGEFVASVRLAGGARSLASLLRQARGHALARNVVVQVVFDEPRATAEMRAGTVLLASQPLPPRITFAALPVRGHITFGPLGTAENGTITLAAGVRIRQIVVNQRGRVRLS